MANVMFDYKQEGTPSTPADWATWLQPSTGNYSVYADGSWVLMGCLKKDYLGFLPASGGVVDGKIDGAHGHAPLSDADILEALRVNGVNVVTEVDLGAWSERIKAEINVVLNLQKAATAPGEVPTDETLLGMIQWKHGSIAIRNDKTFNFLDPSGPGGDLRPQFPDSSRPDWSNCTVIAWIEGLANPLDGGGSQSGDAFIPASFQDVWNLGFPTGIYIQWQSRNPPVLKAHCVEKSAVGNTWLAVGFVVIGRR